MNTGKKIELFDTTLRDGSQKSVDYPTDEQAALIAVGLTKLGIKHIEIGVPAADNQTKERLELIIKAVKETGENPTLYGFCRCVKSDIDAVLDKMETSENKGVNIVVSGSELFQILRDSELKNKNWEELSSEEILEMENKILESIKTQVSYAKTLFSNVRVCFEDGSMGKKEFLLKAVKVAGESGAGVISLPDTLGGVLYHEIFELFEYLVNETKDLQQKGMKFAVHAHDDRGLALSNSLGALEGGATSVEGTLLGSGERVGNLNLKDFIGNMSTLEGRILKGEKFELEGIVLKNLYETYKIIYALLGKKWDPYTRFVGEFCTKTQVGIHQSLENKGAKELEDFFKTYGRFTPYSLINTNDFGVPELDLNIYTNLSGFSNLEKCLEQYGIKISKDDPLVNKILDGIKPDLNNTKIVFASRIYLEYLIQTGEIEKISNKNINISNENLSITLNIGGKKIILESELTQKDGLLGTAVNAINEYLAPDYNLKLTDFSLSMHEGVKRVAERYDSILLDIYNKLNITNGSEQMGISDIEGLIIHNNTNEKIPFTSTAFDLHGNIANIKALLYGCIPLIYEKEKKDNF